MNNILLVVISLGEVVTARDEGFSVAALAFVLDEIDLLEELFLVELQLPHLCSLLRWIK